MMDSDQVRPLAPSSSGRQGSDSGEAFIHQKKLRRKRWIKCCGCIGVTILIQVIVVVILIFTVFRVRDPVIRMNGVTVDRLDLINGTTPRPGSNMSLTADISVKNPNYASFKYRNTTTTMYYRGEVIGEARGPPGQSKARRTMRMNITIDIITDQILGNPNLQSDLGSNLLTMTTYTSVRGRVKMLEIIRRHVTVKMNCSVTINVTSRAIQEQRCKRKVKL